MSVCASEKVVASVGIFGQLSLEQACDLMLRQCVLCKGVLAHSWGCGAVAARLFCSATRYYRREGQGFKPPQLHTLFCTFCGMTPSPI